MNTLKCYSEGDYLIVCEHDETEPQKVVTSRVPDAPRRFGRVQQALVLAVVALLLSKQLFQGLVYLEEWGIAFVALLAVFFSWLLSGKKGFFRRCLRLSIGTLGLIAIGLLCTTSFLGTGSQAMAVRWLVSSSMEVHDDRSGINLNEVPGGSVAAYFWPADVIELRIKDDFIPRRIFSDLQTNLSIALPKDTGSERYLVNLDTFIAGVSNNTHRIDLYVDSYWDESNTSSIHAFEMLDEERLAKMAKVGIGFSGLHVRSPLTDAQVKYLSSLNTRPPVYLVCHEFTSEDFRQLDKILQSEKGGVQYLKLVDCEALDDAAAKTVANLGSNLIIGQTLSGTSKERDLLSLESLDSLVRNKVPVMFASCITMNAAQLDKLKELSLVSFRISQLDSENVEAWSRLSVYSMNVKTLTKEAIDALVRQQVTWPILQAEKTDADFETVSQVPKLPIKNFYLLDMTKFDRQQQAGLTK